VPSVNAAAMPALPDLSRKVVLAGDGLRPELAHLLTEGGITSVLLTRPDQTLERACVAARIQVLPLSRSSFGGLSEVSRAGPVEPVVFTGGLTPGVTRLKAGADAVIAGATGQVWVDANVHWVACLRALYPGRPALLSERPGEGAATQAKGMPPDVLELALAEARVAGGNRVLSLSPQSREALLRGERSALAAWRQLGRTSAWLRGHAPLFGGAVYPAVTQLTDAREETAELANLMYRRNVSPRLVNAANPPPPDPAGIRVLVAAGITPPNTALRSRILAHASAGATVVVDAPPEQAWWRVPALRSIRVDEDRRIYSLGSGKLVAYNGPITDPGQFTLDVIDLLSHKQRAVRIWDAPAAIGLVSSGPDAGPLRARAVLGIVNYGSAVDGDVLTRVHGTFNRAVLLRPESQPVDLKLAHRGAATEIFLPGLGRIAAVLFT